MTLRNDHGLVDHDAFWSLFIVVLNDYGNNLVQAEDNNVNGIDEMTSILWDIMALCESKHIWQMANETWEEWIWFGFI